MTTAKMDRARHALAAAETAVGLRAQSVSVPAHSSVTSLGVGQVEAGSSVAVRVLGGSAEATQSDESAEMRRSGEAASSGPAADSGAAPPAGVVADSGRIVAVPPALSPLFPAGGIRRGTAVQVMGSTSVLLSLAQRACGQEAWCVLVGMPDVGLAAAAAAQLCLDRVVVVPRPGPDAAAVLGALLDGFDVLVLGPCPGLAERDRRALHSRLRHRGAVLLTPAPWPGTDLILAVGESTWAGVGSGHGVLGGREMMITAVGRGAAAGRQATVRVRVGTDGLVSAEQSASGAMAPAEMGAPAPDATAAELPHGGSVALHLPRSGPAEVIAETLWAEAG